MEYVELYQFAQNIITERSEAGKSLAIVPVSSLKDELIRRIGWLADINFHPVETKDGDPLGHYECYSDTDSRWDDPDAWVVLITYDATKLNICKQRFVWCKELMHIFDTEDGSVKTADEYRGLLTEIELKPIDPSEAYLSENMAKWMALLILCPKQQRDEMMGRAAAEGLTDYDVALHFRIPEVIVSSLFSTYYDKYYERFVGSAARAA
jgi:hypothetical protein